MKEVSQNPALALTLRPVRPEDERFLFEVYASTRAEELTQTGWDEAQKQAFLLIQFAAQQHHYSTHFPEGHHQIIVKDGTAVGRIYTAKIDGEIRILDIALLPEHRDAGSGTSLLKDILADAEKTGRKVRIYVESFNRSLRLFERLGFSSIETSGILHLMEWRPKT
jgi:ribosomal protein S18 acetylase RimI-like enzyme